MCVRDRASHTQDTVFVVMCLWRKLESIKLYFWRDMSIKILSVFLVALVILKGLVAAALGPVTLRCDEMLSLAGVEGGTDRSSETSWSRAAPGHTQQAHTGEFYMLCQPRGSLYTSCRAVWEDRSHFSVQKKKKKTLYRAGNKPPAANLPNQTY